jgi:hypothetical protein
LTRQCDWNSPSFEVLEVLNKLPVQPELKQQIVLPVVRNVSSLGTYDIGKEVLMFIKPLYLSIQLSDYSEAIRRKKQLTKHCTADKAGTMNEPSCV